VRVYEPGLDGLSYVLKGLSGPDAYESSKFDRRTSDLTISEGLRRVLASLARVGDRRLAQQQRRLARFAGFATATPAAVTPDVPRL
jgi:hypothetical protein